MKRRVVIVGSGFGGLNAAKALRGADVEITIVDRRNFHLFQPLLYQVAMAALNPSDIAHPIRSIFKRQENVAAVLLGEVTDVDVENRQVVIDGEEIIPYDYLVLATGATHSYFGNEQWREFAPGLKTVEDALEIRANVLSAFERAERNPQRAETLMTFVVVGGGPTGVELAGALAEIAVHAMAKEFDKVDPHSARIVLVEGANRLLPPYPNSLSVSARKQLEGLGVEVMTDTSVVAIDEDGVSLSSGLRIDSGTVIWAAGVMASPVGKMIGTVDPFGRVVVDDDLSAPGYPEVFVVGDLAAIDGVPGVAPAAIQMGRHAADVIRTGERKPFRYRDRGALATIGRARGVANIRFFGFGVDAVWPATRVVVTDSPPDEISTVGLRRGLMASPVTARRIDDWDRVVAWLYDLWPFGRVVTSRRRRFVSEAKPRANLAGRRSRGVCGPLQRDGTVPTGRHRSCGD